ncbi:MAG TPA: PAS domain S-box protein [Gaiellaceae bacterium]|nr:PAS domain S-box protein [Gaiellaceae bacterium]
MASLLLVDDRPQNLLALQAILEPLAQDLHTASSGEEALKQVLEHDFAAILLDVQMPGMDGFETARTIKSRPRSHDVPIIFLTAISKEERHVFEGYEAGAVDYVFKPFDPVVLRSKVAVLVDLWEKTDRLREQEERLREQQLAELRRESEERYRRLADAMPQIVWTTDVEGRATYYNRRWFEYTGMRPEEAGPEAWAQVCHPDDLPTALARREATLVTGDVFEIEYRFRRAGGSYRWHLGRAVPMRGDDGAIDFWVGTATDIHDRKRVEEAQRFLLEAGDELASGLDYRRTLAAVARLAVPAVADWCSVHIVEPDGTIRELEIAHADPDKIHFVRELQERFPPRREAETGAPAVIRSGVAQLIPEIGDEMLEAGAEDEIHLGLIRQLGLRSFMCVPLRSRDRTLGAVTFVGAESGRLFDEVDLRIAEGLAGRAAAAIDNAELYREAQERAQAALVLASIADGVLLLDREGQIQLWNDAAEQITGLPRAQVIGRKAAEALPGCAEALRRVSVDGTPETVPVDVGGRELWLSFTGVELEDGAVYAFRDLTEERAVDRLKSDFVATVSHELRTPLAAIYGAAVTLRRDDLQLEPRLVDKLLDVIGDESERLATIVNDVLLASHLDSGELHTRIEACDGAEIVRGVLESARAHAPESIELELDAPESLPPVAADEQQLRQVFVNLIENAIKYSPDGGTVSVRLEAQPRSVHFTFADEGLGVPASERRRIFEKFYRLDPDMTRGIGGTGLGLYICRELVHRLQGRIWVEPNGKGSAFHVEIPSLSGREAQGVPAAASPGRKG